MYIRSRGVVGLVDGVFYRLNDDFSGMKADTDLQTRISEPRDRILHGQSGQTATNGMILVRARGTEKRHHAIALYLVDDTVVAMNGILHEVKHGLEPSHAQFRIAEAVNQTRRISDVSEE
jgi:ribosomal protein L27